MLRKKPGDEVRTGDVLMELRADEASRIPSAFPIAAAAVSIADAAPTPSPLILERLD
jgi:thymidine phosphorylase